MELVGSRRLTGPNIHCGKAGAVVEVRLSGGGGIAAWRAALNEALEGLAARGQDWAAELGGVEVHVRSFRDDAGQAGAELMFTAPLDRLYVATEVNERAVAGARGEPPEFSLDELASRARAEAGARRGALALVAAAEARGLPWLLDDERLSLGYYGGVLDLDLGQALPAPEAIDWSSVAGGKLAVITGTNGKTTTTRMLARIAKLAGLRAGNTSTDGLYVDGELVEAGDWTGPGGARILLRDPQLRLALLEAARGGLLRRGLGVQRCDVGVITNVDRDHLGEYGIFDLEGMAAAKGVVARATRASGRVVLGADSPGLVAWAEASLASGALSAPVVWCSLDPRQPALVRSRAAGGEVWTVLDGQIARCEGEKTTVLVGVEALPSTLGGHARHNVANALTAAAAARGLGFDDAQVIAGLRDFGRRPADNPGRARLWSVPLRPAQVEAHRGGVEQARLLIDFAHNDAGIAAMAELVEGLLGGGSAASSGADGGRPVLCFGMAGDRSDEDLLRLGRALRAFRPRALVLREQRAYLRGRAPGEVPELLAQGYGAGPESGPREGLGPVQFAEDELGSIELALRSCVDGDLIVLLAHTEREAVAGWLRDRSASG